MNREALDRHLEGLADLDLSRSRSVMTWLYTFWQIWDQGALELSVRQTVANQISAGGYEPIDVIPARRTLPPRRFDEQPAWLVRHMLGNLLNPRTDTRPLSFGALYHVVEVGTRHIP